MRKRDKNISPEFCPRCKQDMKARYTKNGRQRKRIEYRLVHIALPDPEQERRREQIEQRDKFIATEGHRFNPWD